jgi:hypothetical protein
MSLSHGLLERRRLVVIEIRFWRTVVHSFMRYPLLVLDHVAWTSFHVVRPALTLVEHETP